MKIAYFGLPLGALLLAADGHELAHAVVGRPGALGSRRLLRHLGSERVSLRPTLDAGLRRRLEGLGVELVVSWFFPKKLPPWVLQLAPRGSVGVHPSLLPRHRGADPTFWAIDQGDTVTGVTAHRLRDVYDTGAMLAQEQLTIDPTWNAWTLAKKLDRPSLRVLRKVVAALARGEVIEIEQDESLATQAPEPSEEELSIDPSWSAERALRRVRATSPWPGAYFMLGDEPVVVERAEEHVGMAALRPGELAVLDDGSVLLTTAHGALRLLRVRLETESGDELCLEAQALTQWARSRAHASSCR